MGNQNQQLRERQSQISQKISQVENEIREWNQQLQNTQSQSVENVIVQKKLILQVEKRNELNQQLVNLQNTLDEVKLHITYTPMPECIRKYSKMFEAGIKTVLMPYIASFEHSSQTHGQINVELKFQPQYNTFNMVLQSEQGTVRFHNIRVPENVQKMLPFVASEYQTEQFISTLQGARLYPKCRIGHGVVQSFSNKTYTYQLDDCYHILSADSRREMTHSVMAKTVSGKKHIKLFVLGSKMKLRPTHQQEIEIEVDGQRVNLNRNERREVMSQNRKVTYRVHRTSNDGNVIEVENTRSVMQGQLKGLCGSASGDKRENILTAQSCLAQSSQAAALTYRHKDQSC